MFFRLLPLLLLLMPSLRAERLEMRWPTPAASSERWSPGDAILQPTASGETESGGFGCVRSNGYRFHEGVDIRPMNRDRRGEPTDEIFAAMDGVVRHINTSSGESSYGRYIVIDHPGVSPAVYTLYAHLSKIASGLRRGDTVRRGQVIATMGRSAGGYAIPRDRAHLHFEVGLWMTQSFQTWYAWKKFGSPNQHGVFNGMNLLGIDALDFFRQWKAGRVDGFAEFFMRMRPALRLRIATTRTPDFIQRYPALLSKERGSGLLGGWEISCNVTGLPFRWTPLDPREVADMRSGEVRIIETDDSLLRQNHCKDLTDVRRGKKVPGRDLASMLELIFNLR